MISNPRHGLPPRLMAHQPTRFATAQESKPSPSSGIRIRLSGPVSGQHVIGSSRDWRNVTGLRSNADGSDLTALLFLPVYLRRGPQGVHEPIHARRHVGSYAVDR